MKLKISDEVSLPVDAVTERLAFVGQSGSGKTYAAMRLGELMLEAGDVFEELTDEQLGALSPDELAGIEAAQQVAADFKRFKEQLTRGGRA